MQEIERLNAYQKVSPKKRVLISFLYEYFIHNGYKFKPGIEKNKFNHIQIIDNRNKVAFSITSLFQGDLNFYFRPPCLLSREEILTIKDKIKIHDTYNSNKHLSVNLSTKENINTIVTLLFNINFNNNFADEIVDLHQELYEGLKKTITVNTYERSSKARQKCIDKYGYKCIICQFDFEKKYGIIGKDFIHVHHVKPLSEIDKEYKIDPIEDLRPVCPNCHAMLHKKRPAFSIDEIKNFLD